MMESSAAVVSLAALAHEMRLSIFRLLVVAGPSGLTPGAVADELGLPAATLSFHLKELARAELVTQERSGRHLIYRAAFDRMNALIAYLTDNCCQGEACLPAQASSTGCC
jgi:ArsR family transcriptional regulator, arsenate/arsenite/antimonite-responsive transcriptional repressor